MIKNDNDLHLYLLIKIRNYFSKINIEDAVEISIANESSFISYKTLHR